MISVDLTEQISVITFGNIPFESESDFIYSIFEAAARENINVDMISKASVSTDRTSVGFTFMDEDMPRMLNVLSSVRFYRPPLVSCGNVKILIKSDEMASSAGFAMKVFAALKNTGVTAILITTSADEISLMVRESDSRELAAELERRFNSFNN